MPPRQRPYDGEGLRTMRVSSGSRSQRQYEQPPRGRGSRSYLPEEDDDDEDNGEAEEEEEEESVDAGEEGEEEDLEEDVGSSEEEEDDNNIRRRRRHEDEEEDEGEEDEEDDDDEEDAALQEDQDEDDEEYEGSTGKRGRKRKAYSRSRRAWRRLTVEERESVTMEGGIIWEEANSIFAGLNKRQRTAAQEILSDILTYVDRQLERVVIPPTLRMPHASTGSAAAKVGLASNSAVGSSLGSMMSWRAERGGILRADLGNEDAAGAARPDQNGFMADIRTLENLLRPEAAEILSMEQGLLEQQAELDRYKSILSSLQRDRQERRRSGGAKARETRRRLRAMFDALPTSSGETDLNTVLPITVDAALRESAAASIRAAR